MSSFNLFRVILVFVTMMLLSLGSFAAGEKQPQGASVVAVEVATTESFSAEKGFTLWATFIAEKLPRKDWPKYWVDACTLSKKECTDPVWRNIQVGTQITVPRAPEKILAEQLLLSKATVAETKPVQAAQSPATLSVQKSPDATPSLATQWFPVIIALAALCGLVVLGVLASRFFARRSADAEKASSTDDEFPLFAVIDPTSEPLPTPVADDSPRAGSIVLTCASTNGLFKTALDESGKRYIIRKVVPGYSDVLQVGDIFYADVANNGRVTFLHPTHSSTITNDTPATESGKDGGHAHSSSSFVSH